MEKTRHEAGSSALIRLAGQIYNEGNPPRSGAYVPTSFVGIYAPPADTARVDISLGKP
jgi:hypothetical protein